MDLLNGLLKWLPLLSTLLTAGVGIAGWVVARTLVSREEFNKMSGRIQAVELDLRNAPNWDRRGWFLRAR